MKLITLFLLSFIIICCTNREVKNNSNSTIEKIKLIGNTFQGNDSLLSFELIQEITVDLNSDGFQDQIILEKIKESINPNNSEIYEWTDPGDIHRITISINKGTSLTLLNKEGWVNNSSLSQYNKDFGTNNIVKSKYIVVRKASQENTLIFLQGYSYASSPGLLTLINVYQKTPIIIFNLNTELFDLRDINKDGILDVCTTVWDGYYQDANKNKYRYKAYLLNGGLTLDENYSRELSESLSNKAEEPK